jgi:hypothetical protein
MTEARTASGRSFEVVTTMTAEGYDRYGRTMIETFDRYWPREVPLAVYAEGFSEGARGERIERRDLIECAPGLVAFKQRHANSALAHGRSPWPRPRIVNVHSSGPRRLKLRLHRRGYKWQAVRFSHKVFAILHAAETSPADVLIWIDADTRFFADVTMDRLESFLPEGRFVGCLRRHIHTECGFVAYGLRHPGTGALLAEMRRFYTEDRLFEEEEFHDSYLFDIARARQEAEGHLSHDIAEGVGATAKHVLVNSPLGAFMDHLKGDRKDAARSRADDLIAPRQEAYWSTAGEAEPASPTREPT